MLGIVSTHVVKAGTTPSGTYGTDYISYGDVDLNNKVNSADALSILQNTVGKVSYDAKKKNVGDVTLDTAVTVSDALTVLQYSVDKITRFTDQYYIDKVGGGTNGASADNIPDKYQKKVTFKVSNGKWSSGATADIIQYKTLKNSTGYSLSATASLSAPTGMTRNYGYTGGAWNTTVPTSVTGNAAVTYTYSFSRMSVNYTIQHYRTKTYSTYPSSPTATETKTGYVGDTVTATAKSYAGYSVVSSKSTTSIKLEETSNVLKLYYGVSSSNYITSYSKTNVSNGAYTKDTSSDNSFSANISSLKPYTLYRVTINALKSVNAHEWGDDDYSRLFYSLQGLINRDFGMDSKHTTMVYAHVQGSYENVWLNYINTTDSILRKSSAAEIGDGLTQVNITTWDSLYSTFKDVIKSCGIVLWDGNVPATANVAATICGVDGYLPVLAESPLHKKLVADGVPVKYSLVGMFKDGQQGTKITGASTLSTGSAKNDAYLWAIEKYMNRCSATYMGYMVDGAACLQGYDAYPDHISASFMSFERWKQLYNHDYLIARRAFVFDLNPYAGEASTDDPAQVSGKASIGADAATLKFILQRRYDRANGAFGQVIGFPPWWAKYSKDYGVGSQPATYLEWLFTETITCYNLAKEADAAGMTAMTNGSAYYKYVPKKAKYTNNHTALENLTFDKNTFYYTIYVGDYDSSAWLKNLIPGYFDDTARGTIPLMWSINPNLSYRVPMAFDYMFDKMTAKDYIVGGDGGAGYIIPEALFHEKPLAYMGEKRPSGNAAAGTLWSNYSKPFYDRFGYEMTGFIINGAQHSITKSIAESISAYSPKLNFTNCHNTPLVKYNNTYFVHCSNETYVGWSEQMYNHAATYMASGINFSAYRTIVLEPTNIKKVVTQFNDYAASKGLSVKYVDPYTYYNVIKASGQGTDINAVKELLVSFDTVDNFSTEYATNIAIETNNKTQGIGTLRADFTNVAGYSDSKVGGMVFYQFPSTQNLSGYKEISFDYWFTDPVTGSAALQVNFVTNGINDGFNFLIPLDGTTAGWHTFNLKMSSPSVTTNGADWSNINAIRFTYFNYDGATSPNFIMFDNMQAIKY